MYCLVGLQLQLQRNEVIALINLLNRLSESVKFVNERGSSIEKLLQGKIAEPELAIHQVSTLQRIWKFVV